LRDLFRCELHGNTISKKKPGAKAGSVGESSNRWVDYASAVRRLAIAK
jgi:hypothetical protein